MTTGADATRRLRPSPRVVSSLFFPSACSCEAIVALSTTEMVQARKANTQPANLEKKWPSTDSERRRCEWGVWLSTITVAVKVGSTAKIAMTNQIQWCQLKWSAGTSSRIQRAAHSQPAVSAWSTSQFGWRSS